MAGDNGGTVCVNGAAVRAGWRLVMGLFCLTRQMAGFAREPSDSQIDGGCGLAAKSRQLERAARWCWRWRGRGVGREGESGKMSESRSRVLLPIFSHRSG